MHAMPIRRLAGPAVIAVVLTVMTLTGTAAQAAPRAVGATASTTAKPSYTPPPGVTDPCPQAAPGDAGCAALTSAPAASAGSATRATPGASAVTPAGYSPTELQAAYDLGSTPGRGETVGVVTAYNDPDAASDLATYRSQYGLSACTVANGCFQQVSETGSTTSLPGSAAGWTVPVAESIDMISAICPSCHILLVEATSSAITDLGTAENEAVTLGAKFIDNDWWISEAQLTTQEPTYDSEYFDHPGVAITAPAGDYGYGTIEYPAASPYVTAVGGTTLTKDSSVSRGYTETVWAGTSSGCSAYEPKPSWQTDTGCAGRTLNDTAADADPSSGSAVAYYDTPTESGWGEGGGTTVAAAIVAATYALAGTPAPGSNPASYLYEHPVAFRPIISGSNGICTLSYLCNGGTGYNAPSGEGTPYGYTAFRSPGAKPATVTATNGNTWVFATTTSGDIEADSLPSGSSNWSGLSSLGGGPWTGYPTALAAADGSIWVFALNGGNVYADHLPSGSTTWSGWSELGNSGNPMTGQAVPAQDNSGNIWLFARDGSGSVYVDELASGSTTWTGFTTDLDGDFPDNVSVVVGSGGFMQVAGIGNNGLLRVNTLPPGGTWSGWTAISGATVTGTPAITQGPSATDYIFARQYSDDTMMTADLPGGTSSWSSLSSIGDSFPTDPTALTGGGGTVWVLAIGLDSAVLDNELGGSGTWSDWTNDGGDFAGVPGFSEDGSSVFHAFAVAPGGALETNSSHAGTSTWSGWTTLGSSFAGS